METSFESALKKVFPNVDVEYWLKQLGKFPPDTWIMPTNHGDNDYSLFNSLFEVHLVARKYMPQWSNGMFKGAQVYFKYNLDLKFE